jgi:hypothetical protein
MFVAEQNKLFFGLEVVKQFLPSDCGHSYGLFCTFCSAHNQILHQFMALQTKFPQSIHHNRYQRDTDFVTKVFHVRYEQVDGAIVFGLAMSKD